MLKPSVSAWLNLAQRLQESTGYRCLIYPGNIYFVDERGSAQVLPVLPDTSLNWVGFAGLDFPDEETICWRSFSAPFFSEFVQEAVPWSREQGYKRWSCSPVISPKINGVLRGMGWNSSLVLDLEDTYMHQWLEDHVHPYYDLFRTGMKESTYMKYLILSEADRLNIASDRLRAAESDYYRTSLEVPTQAPVAPGMEDANANYLTRLEASVELLQTEVKKLKASVATNSDN